MQTGWAKTFKIVKPACQDLTVLMYIFHLITESLIRDKKMKPFEITSLIKLHSHRELDQLVVYELHHTFFQALT